MNVTATLFGQLITFAVLVWFISKFLWGPITQMMADRNRKIADGLAAAEQGEQALRSAEAERTRLLGVAKGEAGDVIARAEHRAVEIVEEARADARAEADRIVLQARADAEQEMTRAKGTLRNSLAGLVVEGAERILAREVDRKIHEALLAELTERL